MLNDRGPFFYTSSLISHSCPYKFYWDKPIPNNVGNNYSEFTDDLEEVYINDVICEQRLNKILIHFKKIKFLYIKSLFLNPDFTMEMAREWGNEERFKNVETLVIVKNANLEYISGMFQNLETFYAKTVDYTSCMKKQINMPKLRYLSLYNGNIKMVNNIAAPLKELDIIMVGGIESKNSVEILNKFVDSLRISVDLYKCINYNTDYKLLQFYNSGVRWERRYQEEIVKINIADFIVPYNSFAESTIDKLITKYKNNPKFIIGAYSTDPKFKKFLNFPQINFYDGKFVMMVENGKVTCNFPIFNFQIVKHFLDRKILIEKEYKYDNIVGRRKIEYDPSQGKLSLTITSPEYLIETLDSIFNLSKNIKNLSICTKGFTLTLDVKRRYNDKTVEITQCKI